MIKNIKMINFDLQPTLSDAVVHLQPLKATDFERLYAVASDPLVWEQHPNKNRYQRPVFETFFEGAMQSGGAFLILDAEKKVVGSSRFYELDSENKSVAIGYTFFARDCWGRGINRAAKYLMLKHAFRYVDKVIFHIGAENTRSQIAIGRIGAQKIGSLEMPYFGEKTLLNFVYCIEKANFEASGIIEN